MPGTADEELIVEARLRDLLTPAIGKMSNKVKAGFDGMADRARKAQSKMSKAFTGVKKDLISFAKTFGPAALLIGAFTKALQLAGRAIDFVREKTIKFEKTMSTVKAILRPTAQEFAELADQARMLGETTAFSASEAGEAFVELGKLGFQANQIIASSADVLNLAAVANVEMAQAAEVTAKTLGQFGLRASDATSVVDIMAKSFNISALDINKFQESMKFAGATANKVGLDLQGTTAALAQLAKSGIEGSQAGTALRRIMLELSISGSKAAKQVGFTVDSVESFQKALFVLQTKGLSAGEIKDTFGLLSSTAAGILIDGAEGVKEFDEQLRNAKGTAQEFADTMLDNVAGATKILESAQEGLALAIGEAFGPANRKRIQLYTDTINFATSFIKAHRGALETLVNFFSGAFVLAFKSAAFVVRLLVISFEKTQTAFFSLAQGFVKGAGLINKLLTKMGIGFEQEIFDKLDNKLGQKAEDAFQRMKQAIAGVNLGKEMKKQMKDVEDAIKPPGGAGDDFDLPNTLTKEQEAAAKAKIKKFDADVKALREGNMKLSHEGRLDLLAEQRTELLDQAKAGSEEEFIIMKAFRDKVSIEITKQHVTKAKLAQKEASQRIKDFKKTEAIAKKEMALEKAKQRERINTAQTVTSSLSTILQLTTKNAKAQQKIALVESIINGALGISKAVASAPPPANIPAVIAATASAVSNTATIASQAFVNGGFPIGRDAMIKVNEKGQESVLNAQATSTLGTGAINRLNSGGTTQNTVTNEIIYSPTIKIENDANQDIVSILSEDKQNFATFFREEIIEKGFLEESTT